MGNLLPAAATVEGPTICRREIEILLFILVYQDLLAVTAVTAVFATAHKTIICPIFKHISGLWEIIVCFWGSNSHRELFGPRTFVFQIELIHNI
jgi:hypothetical protein